jgi:sugar phosphate permease
MGQVGGRATNVRYVVLFGLCLAAGLAYIHRGAPSVMESTIRADLQLTADETGRAFGIFFWAYAICQIPTGLLVDRIGPRRALFIFGLLGAVTMAMSAGTMWSDATTGFVILYVARLLMGIAQAGLFPASTRAITNWFPLHQRGFAAGMLQSWMSLGGAIGAFVTGTVLGYIAWPWVFLLYSVPGVLWSMWFFYYFRDRPDQHPSTNEAEHLPLVVSKKKSEAFPWPLLLPNFALLLLLQPFQRAVFLLCLQQFFRAAANVFWFTWCPTYLQETHGLSREAAGQWTSVPIIGVVLGSLLGGMIVDRIYIRTHSKWLSRSGTAIVVTLLGVLLFVSVYFVPTGQVLLAISLLLLAALFSSGGNACGYSGAMDLGGKNLAAVFGAMNMCGNFGAAIFSEQAPKITKNPEYGWASVVLLVAGSYFLGALCWIFLNPNRADSE